MDSPEPENGLVRVCRQESQARYMAGNLVSAYIGYECIILGHNFLVQDFIPIQMIHNYFAKWRAHSLQLKY